MLAVSITSAAPAFMYGIDSFNEIIEYDPVNKVTRVVKETDLNKRSGSNAFGFDEARNQMFWFYKGDKTGGPNLAGLYYWDQVTGAIDRIASQEQSWTNQRFPLNADFYPDPSTGNSYFVWVTGGGSTVNFLPITYDVSDNPIGVGSRIQRTITGPDFSPDSMNFGDIAIKTSTDTLYLATALEGGFAKIDLDDAFEQPTLPYTEITRGNPPLQVAFDCEEEILYGQQLIRPNNNFSDNWYTIDLETGVATSIPDYSTTGRLSAFDLGGSACSASPQTTSHTHSSSHVVGTNALPESHCLPNHESYWQPDSGTDLDSDSISNNYAHPESHFSLTILP
ncbi:hypothetical protein NGA_0695300 [Nannochloropsis gaditana CCMP526]|uniref:uncharacterized protein n=1 Tax=Nannochloropsis gaditana (strain CCMP526) TaxID=1093141 RepID=UPI00029F533C|nr:hypothetical protein NGA_0695300 [Nannochloropsis gaditana CCMP526]EKU23368.1 hypothetical protein NGA_0695300 [Nannochloropsis gaditana CCMP526]|eukprot:XP_005852464.1 hypothetical protein NGA_0695300 [Nannochloropsis gaditana CCMP526]